MNGKTNVFYKLAFKLITLINKVINKDVDVPYLQKKYKATRGTVIEIYITHTPTPSKPPKMEIRKYFKIKNGKAVLMDEAKPDATVWCELNTMLN
ncbi:unnamed protein product, partial [marine sediment metagenome]